MNEKGNTHLLVVYIIVYKYIKVNNSSVPKDEKIWD